MSDEYAPIRRALVRELERRLRDEVTAQQADLARQGERHQREHRDAGERDRQPEREPAQGRIGLFQARLVYALEAMGDATKLTNAVELGPSSIASSLLGPLAAPRVRAAVASNLEGLKQVLEARPRGLS